MFDSFCVFAPLTEDELFSSTNESEARAAFMERMSDPWFVGQKITLEGWRVTEKGESRTVLASGRVCEA